MDPLLPTQVEVLKQDALKQLIEKAKALVEQLNTVHSDSRYQAVWKVSQLHIGPYEGPQYGKELVELQAALSRTGSPQVTNAHAQEKNP